MVDELTIRLTISTPVVSLPNDINILFHSRSCYFGDGAPVQSIDSNAFDVPFFHRIVFSSMYLVSNSQPLAQRSKRVSLAQAGELSA